MEEIIKYAIFIIIMAVIIIAVLYFGYAQNVLESQKLSGDELIFESLCAQWRSRNCTDDALADINYAQTDYYEEKTLTDLCTQLYNQSDEEKTVTICKDICKNKCNSKLWFDVGLASYDIKAVEANKVSITIHNYGSGTVYDITAEVYDITTSQSSEPDWTITIDELSPGEEYTDKFEITNDQELFLVQIDIEDASDDNNEAQKDIRAIFT